MQNIFRVSEASRILGVHPAHLYRLVRDGQVTPTRRHPLSFNSVTLRRFLRRRYQFLNELFPEIKKEGHKHADEKSKSNNLVRK